MKYQDKTNHLSLITQTANLPNKKKMREGFFLNTTYNTTYQKLLIENPIIKLHQFIKVDELQQLKLRKYKSLTPDKELIFGYLIIQLEQMQLQFDIVNHKDFSKTMNIEQHKIVEPSLAKNFNYIFSLQKQISHLSISKRDFSGKKLKQSQEQN